MTKITASADKIPPAQCLKYTAFVSLCQEKITKNFLANALGQYPEACSQKWEHASEKKVYDVIT